MNLSMSLVVGGFAIANVCLSWLYWSRWQIVRPPVGVIGLGDVLVTLGGVVVIPLLYLAAPAWVVIALLALGALSAVYVAVEPVLRSPAIRWLIILAALTGEVVALTGFGPGSTEYFLVNNVIVMCGVVGVSNLWAQSGLRARDTAILAVGLTAYDLIATSYLPLMSSLFGRLVELPFSPIVGWPGVDGLWAGIGLGDLVIATVFPLVWRKAYGRSAGLIALVSVTTLLAAILALGAIQEMSIFPVMAVLGPTILIQYVWWARRCGSERTMYQYVREETPCHTTAQPRMHGYAVGTDDQQHHVGQRCCPGGARQVRVAGPARMTNQQQLFCPARLLQQPVSTPEG